MFYILFSAPLSQLDERNLSLCIGLCKRASNLNLLPSILRGYKVSGQFTPLFKLTLAELKLELDGFISGV